MRIELTKLEMNVALNLARRRGVDIPTLVSQLLRDEAFFALSDAPRKDEATNGEPQTA